VPVQVLGASIPLTATSDQTWLTITSARGGAIGFAFQANILPVAAVAHIGVLGQTVTVTQKRRRSGAITKAAGDGQSTPGGQAFPTPLQVTGDGCATASTSGSPL
jgi:hypothetical protein